MTQTNQQQAPKNSEGKTYKEFCEGLKPEERNEALQDADKDIEYSKYLNAVAQLTFLMAQHTKQILGVAVGLTHEEVMTQIKENLQKIASGKDSISSILQMLIEGILRDKDTGEERILVITAKILQHQRQMMLLGARLMRELDHD